MSGIEFSGSAGVYAVSLRTAAPVESSSRDERHSVAPALRQTLVGIARVSPCGEVVESAGGRRKRRLVGQDPEPVGDDGVVHLVGRVARRNARHADDLAQRGDRRGGARLLTFSFSGRNFWSSHKPLSKRVTFVATGRDTSTFMPFNLSFLSAFINVAFSKYGFTVTWCAIRRSSLNISPTLKNKSPLLFFDVPAVGESSIFLL